MPENVIEQPVEELLSFEDMVGYQSPFPDTTFSFEEMTQIQPREEVERSFAENISGLLTNAPREFFSDVSKSFGRGDTASDLDIMSYGALTGDFDFNKDVRPMIDTFESQVRDDPIEGDNILSNAIFSVANMLPAMGKGIAEGFTTGTVAGAGTALLGQAGPQVAFPEEAITVPAAFAFGTTVGSMNYWYKQGAGSLYATLKKEDVDDSVARPVSHIAGAIYGGIEFLQVDKLIPGAKQGTRKLISDSVRKTVSNLVKKHGVNWVQEVGEEGLQEVVLSVAKDIGTNVGEKTNKTIGNIVTTAMTNGWEAAKESAIPLLLLSSPGAAVDIKRIADEKGMNKKAAKKALKDQSLGGKDFEEEQERNKVVVKALSGVELTPRERQKLKDVHDFFVDEGLIEKEDVVKEEVEPRRKPGETVIDEKTGKPLEIKPTVPITEQEVNDVFDVIAIDETEQIEDDFDIIDENKTEKIIDKSMSGSKLTLEEQQAQTEIMLEFEEEMKQASKDLKKNIKGNIKKEFGEEFKIIPSNMFSKEGGVGLDSLATENSLLLELLGYEVSSDGMREFIRNEIGEQGEGRKILRPAKIKTGTKDILRNIKRLIKSRNKQVSNIIKKVDKKLSKKTKTTRKKIDQKIKPDSKELTIKESQALIIKLKAEQKAATKGVKVSKNIISNRIKSLNEIIDSSGLDGVDKDKFRKVLRKVTVGDIFNQDKFDKLVNNVETKLSELVEKQKRKKLVKKILKQPKRPENIVDIKFQSRIDEMLESLGKKTKEKKKSLASLPTDKLEELATLLSRLGEEGRKTLKDKKEQQALASDIIRAGLVKSSGGMPDGTLAKGSIEERKKKKASGSTKSRIAFLRPLRMVREVFGELGEKLFYDSIDAADTQKNIHSFDRQLRVKESMKNNKVTVFGLGETVTIDGKSFQVNNILRMYMATKDKQSMDALLAGNNLTIDEVNAYIDNIKKDKPNYIKFADEVQVIVGERFNELASTMENVFNKVFKKVKFYFPIRRIALDKNTDEVYEGIESELIFEFAEREGQGFSYTSVDKGFTISRKDIKDKFQTEISLDFMGDALRAINTQEHFISYAPLQKVFNKTLNDKSIKDSVVYNHTEDMWKTFNEYLDVNVNPSLSALGANKYNSFVKRLRKGIGKAFLGFNVVTSAKQLPSLSLALKYTSPTQLSISLAKISTSSKARDKVYKLNPALKNRVISRDINEIMAEINNLPDSDIKRRLLMFSKKIDKGAFTMLMNMDKIATLSVYDSVYNFQRRSKSEGEAKDIANKAVLETQPQGAMKDLPAIYRTNNEYLRMILMFTNQLNQLWNMVSSDLPSEVSKKEFGKASKGIASIMISSIGIYIASHGRLPDDNDEWFDAMFGSLISSVPIIGNWGMSWFRGYDPSISPAESLTNNLKILANNIKNEEFIKSSEQALFLISIYSGMPYSQIKRTFTGTLDLINNKTTDYRRLIWSEKSLESDNNSGF